MNLRNYTYQSDFAKKYVAQGVAQGYRAVLQMQLQQRFGALSAEAIGKLENAEADTLKLWLSRVLTAGNLADVFTLDPTE